MTTGSWIRDSFTNHSSGGYFGVKWNRSWSGADRVTVKRPRRPVILIEHGYKDKKTGEQKFKIVKLLDPSFIPPKRARDVPNGYTMTERRMPDELKTFVCKPGSPGGPPLGSNPLTIGTFPVMWLAGTPTWVAVDLLTANDQIKLINKLKELLDGSDFNMGVFIGELGPTLGLIAGTATNLGLALGHAGKGNFSAAAQALTRGTHRLTKPIKDVKHPTKKVIADKWLELQYGWKPLLNDTVDAAKMLAHHLNVPMQTSYRVSVRRESVVKQVTELGPNQGNRVFSHSRREHRRGIIARIQEKGNIPQMLGLTNPELVAWELVPYSFVADWFIPLGQWMAARALVNRLTGTFITSDKRTGIRGTPTSVHMVGASTVEWRSVAFDRTVSTTLKVPMPHFKPLPTVASWQHCANAVGLLVSSFGGRS